MSSMIGSSSSYGAQKMKMPKNITGYDAFRLPTKSPETIDFWRQLMGGVQPGALAGLKTLSGLAGGDESMFAQMEQPAWNAYEQGLGAMGSRFSNMGMGAQRSSGFKQAMGGMAGQFAQDLQSKRMALQQQAIQQLLGMSGQLMGQDPYESMLMKKPPSMWETLLPSLMQGLGQAGGMAMMGGF